MKSGAKLLLFVGFAFVIVLAHIAYLGLPYFWDELGQFVPAALDILRDGAWVPHSTVPNAHPPGVMAYLAAVWRVFGYSITATRTAMLLLASVAAFVTFLLSRRLVSPAQPVWTLAPVLLLMVDPLVYTQSMMAQLDMPAMLFTVLALLLFFEEHHPAAALACMALVLAKETGALIPLVLGAVLLREGRMKCAAYYLAPFLALGLWFFVLWRSTGHLFGDAGFTHYNLVYSLHPARATLSLLRRIYYLFLADFRWAGSLAVLLAWRGTNLYSNRTWKIIWLFIMAHVLMVSLFGGAELERYLLPAVPLVYIAMAAAWSGTRTLWREASFATVAAGLFLGLFWNSPFPLPYEDNLAMADFVQLHRAAAQYLERFYPDKIIYTAWPLTQALRDPVFGYVDQKLRVEETSDLRRSTLSAIGAARVGVLVLYSRTWEPEGGALNWQLVQRFLARFYEYEPQMNAAEVERHFGLVLIKRWSRRGQWIEIYSRLLYNAGG